MGRWSIALAFALDLALGISCALPAAAAQQPGKVHRIGYLRGSSPQAAASHLEAFRQGLRELGYIEGQNIVIEQRHASGELGRLPTLAAELVRLNVDVIVVGGTSDAIAAKAATTTIPVVFTLVGDPVGTGLVASLARPGGNLTGLSNLFGELGGKQLQLLKEAVPRAPRVAVLYNPINPSGAFMLQGTQAAARPLGVQLQVHEVRGPNELASAFSAMAKGRAQAFLTLGDPVFVTGQERILELAAKGRLPGMFFEKSFVEAGGLMCYGPNFPSQFRRAATYVDKILKGTKPADLPVEQPMRFDLAINMKTAKALGLTFPPSILVQATEVIE